MKCPFRRLRRIRDAEGGATALEFAIVAAVFIVVSMGIIEFGRSLQVRNQMAYAMDWGARTVLMDASVTETEITAAIKERFTLYDKDKLTIEIADQATACTVDGNAGNMASRAVTMVYPLQIFIPGFAGTLDMTLERIVPKGVCKVA